jgi:4-hydroxybenzoate polyprenyltransferase
MAFRFADVGHLVRMARPINLGITTLSYALAGFLSCGGSFGYLASPKFYLEWVAILFITAGGYWVNDVFDRRIDLVNKPNRTIVNTKISAKKVLTVYFTAMLVVVVFSVSLLPSVLTALNVVVIWLLYLYAQLFKRTAVVGNVIVASLTALVLFAGGVQCDPYRLSLVWAMGFAFGVNLIREVVKDVEDLRGDLQFDLNTLPILMGIRTTKKIIGYSTLVLMACVQLPWLVNWVLWGTLPWLYLVLVVLLVELPLVFFLRKLSPAIRPAHFRQLSHILKVVMLGGMVCLLTLVK